MRDSGKNKSIGLLCAKTPLDIFFGQVGENCTSNAQKEILNKKFIPNRIIDVDENQLVGYNHLLLFEKGPLKLLIVPGIEPSNKLCTIVDPKDLYAKIYDNLVQYAMDIDATALLYTENPVSLSNRGTILNCMLKEMKDKPMIEIDGLKFPSGEYLINQLVAVWVNPNSETDFSNYTKFKEERSHYI